VAAPRRDGAKSSASIDRDKNSFPVSSRPSLEETPAARATCASGFRRGEEVHLALDEGTEQKKKRLKGAERRIAETGHVFQKFG
jgi:hypothetical protein